MRRSNRETERGKWGALVATVLMMTFIFGCGGDPYAGKYAKTKPNQQSFVGGWLLKKNPVGGTPTKPPTVTFAADGAFKATEYPGKALDEFSRGKSFVDGNGTWAIEQHQSFWVLRIHWQVIDGVQQGYGDMLHILNDRPPYVLHHIIGDPDSGEALVFEQVKK